jgi:predicted Zn-dependent protease
MELLHAADLSSMGMAPFFERMAADGGEKGQSASRVQEFISSHPDTHRRVSGSRARQRPGEPFFTDWEWAAVKATCETRPARAGT